MLVLTVLVAAITPGVALLFYFYLKDKYDAEPLHMVARMFLLGVLVVFPIMIVQQGLVRGLGDNPYLFAFGISSGVEEAFKWFVLYHFIYHHTEFDEPYDGILYAVAVSLGFATLENIIYAFTLKASFASLLLRGLLPVSGHAMFGVVMGYYMGRAKFASILSQKKEIPCAFAGDAADLARALRRNSEYVGPLLVVVYRTVYGSDVVRRYG